MRAAVDAHMHGESTHVAKGGDWWIGEPTRPPLCSNFKKITLFRRELPSKLLEAQERAAWSAQGATPSTATSRARLRTSTLMPKSTLQCPTRCPIPPFLRLFISRRNDRCTPDRRAHAAASSNTRTTRTWEHPPSTSMMHLAAPQRIPPEIAQELPAPSLPRRLAPRGRARRTSTEGAAARPPARPTSPGGQRPRSSQGCPQPPRRSSRWRKRTRRASDAFRFHTHTHTSTSPHRLLVHTLHAAARSDDRRASPQPSGVIHRDRGSRCQAEVRATSPRAHSTRAHTHGLLSTAGGGQLASSPAANNQRGDDLTPQPARTNRSSEPTNQLVHNRGAPRRRLRFPPADRLASFAHDHQSRASPSFASTSSSATRAAHSRTPLALHHRLVLTDCHTTDFVLTSPRSRINAPPHPLGFLDPSSAASHHPAAFAPQHALIHQLASSPHIHDQSRSPRPHPPRPR